MTHVENERSERDGRIEPPAGARVRVVADTEEAIHFVLPVRPDALSAEQLDQTIAGSSGKDTWPDPSRKLSR